MADGRTNRPTRPLRLIKQHTWSPYSELEEAWLRRKDLHERRRQTTRLRRSITDEDVNELRACIDLGFGFEHDHAGDAAAAAAAGGGRRSKRLSETFPALDLYHAVNQSYRESVSESSSGGVPADTSITYFCLDENPEETRARLRQWAQLVACSVRQHRRV